MSNFIFPKKILIGLQEGSCNLKCPKCYTHGTNAPTDNDRSIGVMDIGLFEKIIVECSPFSPRIAPQTWDEPLLTPNFFDYLEIIKKNNLIVTMDTNGFLLTKEKMKRLVELKVDSVSISIDAHSKEVLKATRGVDTFEILKNKVHELLEIRGASLFPRIGVSFVEEAANSHEKDDFINYWIQFVDVVRVNHIFGKGREISIPPSSKRTACWSLYDSLMIHHNGEAALCCMDTHYQVDIGNFRDHSVKDIWNGEFFSKVRSEHESGVFKSICSTCMLWSNDEPRELREGNILTKETNSHSYYNRIDRLDNITTSNRYIKV